MAGLPAPVVTRARDILSYLEAQHVALDDAEAGGTSRAKGGVSPAGLDTQPQMHLFAGEPPDPVASDLKQRLEALDPDRMTPVEALLTLSEWKQLLKEG